MEYVLIIGLYLVCHLPAIIMLLIGISKRKTKPITSKVLLILAGLYFVIGAGMCGALMNVI